MASSISSSVGRKADREYSFLALMADLHSGPVRLSEKAMVNQFIGYSHARSSSLYLIVSVGSSARGSSR